MNIVNLTYNTDSNQKLPIELPLSKSIAARVLTIDFLSGKSTQHKLPDCDDTTDLFKAYTAIQHSNGEEITVNLGSGATSLRFFTSAVAASEGKRCKVVCSEQLSKRPMSPLIETLRKMGADIKCIDKEGFPPFIINGKQLHGGEYDINASMSSQYTSALMLTAPYCDAPTTLHLIGDRQVSLPYVEMTAKLMQHAGNNIQLNSTHIHISNTPYHTHIPTDIEPDWSGASYFYEYALVSQKAVNLQFLNHPSTSLQGDSQCCALFARFGVETVYNQDSTVSLVPNHTKIKQLQNSNDKLRIYLNAQPDLTPAIAVALTLCNIKFRIDGISHLRIKESNRIEAIANELTALGYKITFGNDFISYDGEHTSPDTRPIKTYGDHRIAMSMAIATASHRNLTIENPNVVDKSFPGFWSEIAKLGFQTT